MNWKPGDGNGPSGGPWGQRGSGGNGQGPKRPSAGGGGRGGSSGPDLEAMIRKGQERFRQFTPGGGGGNRGIILFGVAALVLWAASGIYRVGPEEQGVVTRFGEYHRTTGSGLHYHLPAPIEAVMKPKVTRVNREEIGFRSVGGGAFSVATGARSLPEESLMLTGDENIVDINFEVQWKIRDAKLFLFNVRYPEMAVKNAAESAMREVMGSTPIATALAEGRFDIETKTRDLLQQILDSYETGVEVVRLQMLKVDPPAEVIDAFRDVQTARADQERLINQAETYRNDILPRARGEAEKMVLDAQAYKEQVVARAEGEASRFSAILKEYNQAKDVTQKRIYLETMESILAGMDKVVVDDALKGVVPFLPLNDIKRSTGAAQ